jgi:hypothetical protein
VTGSSLSFIRCTCWTGGLEDVYSLANEGEKPIQTCRRVQKWHPLLRAPRAAGARKICVGFADVTRIRRESGAYVTQMLRVKFGHRWDLQSKASRGPMSRPGNCTYKPCAFVYISACYQALDAVTCQTSFPGYPVGHRQNILILPPMPLAPYYANWLNLPRYIYVTWLIVLTAVNHPANWTLLQAEVIKTIKIWWQLLSAWPPASYSVSIYHKSAAHFDHHDCIAVANVSTTTEQQKSLEKVGKHREGMESPEAWRIRTFSAVGKSRNL